MKQNNFFQTETKSTEKWREYPIHLKETLFYFGKKFKQVRDVEVGYKFFQADDLKEQANKEYHKGNYDQAINLLSKSLSFFKWLECTPDSFPNFNPEENDEPTAEEKELDDDNIMMNRLLFTLFHDQNTFLKEYSTC